MLLLSAIFLCLLLYLFYFSFNQSIKKENRTPKRKRKTKEYRKRGAAQNASNASNASQIFSLTTANACHSVGFMPFAIRRADKCLCGADVPAGSFVEYRSGMKPAIRACPACDSSLKPAPAAAGSGGAALQLDPDYVSKLEVECVRETWRDPQGAKAIVKVSHRSGATDKDPNVGSVPFGVVGRWPRVEPGSVWEVHGTWKHHPKHGWTLQASVILPAMGNSDEDLITYLRANIPNFGGSRAKQLFDLCGASREDLFRAFDGSEDSLNLLCEVRGITRDRAVEATRAFQESQTNREAMISLGGLGLSPGMVAKILAHFDHEPDVFGIIQQNPYVLLEVKGFGWDRADEVAHKLGVKDDDVRRGAAALSVLLEQEADEGHTYISAADLGLAGPAQPVLNFGGSAGAV